MRKHVLNGLCFGSLSVVICFMIASLQGMLFAPWVYIGLFISMFVLEAIRSLIADALKKGNE